MSATLTVKCPLCQMRLQWLRTEGRYAGLKAHLNLLHPAMRHHPIIALVSGPTTGPAAVD